MNNKIHDNTQNDTKRQMIQYNITSIGDTCISTALLLCRPYILTKSRYTKTRIFLLL